MNNMLLKNAECYIEGAFCRKDIFLKNGKIVAFDAPCCIAQDVSVLDCSGNYVVPGFIDIHTHGACGTDVNLAHCEEFETAAMFFAKHGTTAFLASVLTDSEQNTLRVLNEIAAYRIGTHRGATLLGAHLEGPFLSHEKKGAMPERYLQACHADLFDTYYNTGVIRYITVAPELEQAAALIRQAAEKTVVALGHSVADYDTTIAAVRAGARAATHTFNAMAGLDRVQPHILGAVLESDVYNEVIADGKHVHPANLRLLYRLKGNRRIIAITDSMQATGLADGSYRLGENNVTLSGDDVFLCGSTTRAGSVLTMDRALRNLMCFLDISLEEALPMLTQNPADLFGLNKGYLRIGYDADIVVLDKALQVCHTIIGGQMFEG